MTMDAVATRSVPATADDTRPRGLSIVVNGLSKSFGSVKAVDGLTFDVAPGQVCGFLGPNGAGKTTTLRCLLGLVRPTAGTATFGGSKYVDLPRPLATVGALLDAANFHPGRSARNHLRVLCAAAGIDDRRADEVLELTGLREAADRRVAGFSTGMRQRLGLAAAILGDPPVLVLDEPATGLDPAGISWLRQLLQHMAHELDKTVLVSSHLLAEMEQTADRVVIISAGKLVREGTLNDLISQTTTSVRARTPRAHELEVALREGHLHFSRDDGAFVIRGVEPGFVGHLAFSHGVELSELTAVHEDLEDVFLQLTNSLAPEQETVP